MISVTRLNGTEIMINAELIETVDANPDTTITLSTGNKLIVKEPVKDVIDKILEYRKMVYQQKNEKMSGGK